MTSLEIAARYAAYTWYLECRNVSSSSAQREAHHFADENWESFLPVADEGWGRLLLRIARRKGARRRLALA